MVGRKEVVVSERGSRGLEVKDTHAALAVISQSDATPAQLICGCVSDVKIVSRRDVDSLFPGWRS